MDNETVGEAEKVRNFWRICRYLADSRSEQPESGLSWSTTVDTSVGLQVQPGQALLRKVLLACRLKARGLNERTDMEMRFRRPRQAFASQGRAASAAEATPRLPRRRIELGDLAFGNGIGFAVK